jgi:hypothetical protein
MMRLPHASPLFREADRTIRVRINTAEGSDLRDRMARNDNRIDVTEVEHDN